MNRSTLTISQLATHVGVTVKAVRHYHACGLLPEPERDASGYRRYDARAVVDLIRIRTLAEAGVPLARIGPLLRASPEEFTAAVADIDRGLEGQLREIQRRRRRLAELIEGERLFLPAEIAGVLDQLRDIGVTERSVELERDGWILMHALAPERTLAWATEKSATLADPDFRRICQLCDQARDWDANDPRLDELEEAVLNLVTRDQGEPLRSTRGESAGLDLLLGYVADVSPAWARLHTVKERLRALR